MPVYRVWYRNNEEPLEFTTPARCNDKQILDHIFEHEHIVTHLIPPAQRGGPPSMAPTVQELITRNNLAPVRYTEDESEMNTIG